MKFSDDAVLQAAATIVAAHISAKTFSVDMGQDENVAGAVESALAAVRLGVKKYAAEVARTAKPRRNMTPAAGRSLAKKLA